MSMDVMMRDAFAALLTSEAPLSLVRSAEQGQGTGALADALDASGFLDALVPEEQGGAGLTLAEFHPLVELAGAHLLPYPFAETALSRALLAGEGAPDGPVIWVAGHVPPLEMGANLALIGAAGGLSLAPVTGTEPDGFGFQQAVLGAERTPCISRGDLLCWGAAVSSTLMVGAMQTVLSLAMTHANDRQQFGRPLGKFQAIQHQLAVMAEQVALARMASCSAFSGTLERPDRWTAGVAKTLANEAADTVAASAHGILGAMGISQDHDLQLYTRRLKRWQMSFGSAAYWARELATMRLGDGDATVDFIRARG